MTDDQQHERSGTKDNHRDDALNEVNRRESSLELSVERVNLLLQLDALFQLLHVELKVLLV